MWLNSGVVPPRINRSSTSSNVAMPTSELPQTMLWSRNDSGRPGTKVCIHSDSRANCTAMLLMSTP